MAPPPGSPPAPHRPARPDGAGSGQVRPAHRRLPPVWTLILGGLVAALVLSCVVAGRLVSRLTQGIPDVFLHTSITYTPPQGPANPALLDSRPEVIAERYLADYIHLAGTYPCVQDLSSQYNEDQDPVLAGQPCPITRPVASYAVTSVTIQTQGLSKPPLATVTIVVTYTTGRQWAGALPVIPYEDVNLVLIYLHLDCWATFGTLQMFGGLVPDIPRGATYSSPDALTLYCKDHAGRIIHL